MNAPLPTLLPSSSAVIDVEICCNRLPKGPMLLQVREEAFDDEVLECHAPGADPSEWLEILAVGDSPEDAYAVQGAVLFVRRRDGYVLATGDTAVKRAEEVELLPGAATTLEAAGALAVLEAGL